ncbi:MAG: hypothetical protein INR62_01660 [Rhodospirillales bacterium]|nr:hypothetical protein [Acetobacter sp.]
MAQQARPNLDNVDLAASVNFEEEIAHLAKRHHLTPATVRGIARRLGSSESGAIEREIEKGKSRG